MLDQPRMKNITTDGERIPSRYPTYYRHHPITLAWVQYIILQTWMYQLTLEVSNYPSTRLLSSVCFFDSHKRVPR